MSAPADLLNPAATREADALRTASSRASPTLPSSRNES